MYVSTLLKGPMRSPAANDADSSPDDDSCETEARACLAFLEKLAPAYRVAVLKVYRLPRPLAIDVPQIPCLDHEAVLHRYVHRHVSAYIVDHEGGYHEVSCTPARSTITIDEASTLGSHGPDSTDALVAFLDETFTEYEIHRVRPSRIRADGRVADTVMSQITLSQVVTGSDLRILRAKLAQLSAIATLIEKSSRVSSWTVRTGYAPLLASAGLVAFFVLGAVGLSDGWRDVLRYGVVGAIGAGLLYVGLKAVHLTQIGTRVWKRCEEYRMIVAAREQRNDRQNAGSP